MLALIPSNAQVPPIIPVLNIDSYDLEASSAAVKKKLILNSFLMIGFGLAIVLTIELFEHSINDSYIMKSITNYMVGVEVLDDARVISGFKFPKETEILFHEEKISNIVLGSKQMYFDIIFAKGTVFYVENNQIVNISSAESFSYGCTEFPEDSFIEVESNKLTVLLAKEFTILNKSVPKGSIVELKDGKIIVQNNVQDP